MGEAAGAVERPRRPGRPRLDPAQQSVTVCVILPEATLDRLIASAAKHRVSVSAELRKLVILTLK